jgi:transposase
MFPLRPTKPTPWQPLTDSEWAALAPLLRPATPRGRPPANLRRTWDAIFWVACSKLPWHHLPPHLGRADTAHRALRRAAKAGTLDRLLIAVSRHPLATEALFALEWRIARAWRRAARLMSLASLTLARKLGMESALPAPPECIPDPTLSESITRLSKLMLAQLREGGGHPFFAPLRGLIRRARGNPRRWRLTA